MKRATVVIGANYGDEGKGRMVDWLAAQTGTTATVVRFNGGAQAGHTVVTPDGRRHVFSHLGSGSFCGARTFLAKHFVCNPILFWTEIRDFEKVHDAAPMIAADPRCLITTPYDIIINQALEDQRGAGRHGSVGVGFGETIERNAFPAFQLAKSSLGDPKAAAQTVRNIRDRYLPQRLRQLGLDPVPRTDKRLDDGMLTGFLKAAQAFDDEVPSAGLEYLQKTPLIFEGAQGLALDMTHGVFPNVTRSNTGLTNVIPIAKRLGLQLDVVYMSRTYATRHGAGPLPGECTPPTAIWDETNTPHAYQGTLRFAPLDPAGLKHRIGVDLKAAAGLVRTAEVAATCADHAFGSLDTLMALPFIRTSWVASGPVRDAIERR